MRPNRYMQASFLKSAPRVALLPPDTGFEVAFAGRSNAGKSSALNTLTGMRQLARTSKTPGRTQLINLFSLDDTRRLVDLPGYGYAKVAKSLKLDWQKHLAEYLETRHCLRGLVVLMDIRHPLKPLDETLIHWALARELPVHILLTKADKLGFGEVKKTVQAVSHHFVDYAGAVTVQAFSATKKQGIEMLCEVLDHWFEMTAD
ncbi:YihA family ribosome biogenesis GTP-binding protein [Legionella geestiana]|uniref:ribosome biogenesis GTP-binding protein YihA/YsxC n=1 Tax=Legionella geestiana TaxID=45065 RepID=UPI0010927437|nr:ribosome biogenesis GTP-binding protein YihA/YsxC [Legionella geestiana]QDQ39834.1 YihA family ribosome biogenesis GTP-binding protein [Legionella geestiana]